MKFLNKAVLTVSLLAVLTVPALAQTRIATVDMDKIFNGYWKTKQASIILDGQKADLAKEFKGMTDDYDRAQTEYKQLLEQANDQAISAEERDKRKQAAADKLKDITNSRGELDQFSRQAQARLAEQTQRMRSNLIADIQKAVADKAKTSGYTLVLNSGAADTVVYSSNDNDLTDPVLKQLNAGAPIDVTQPTTPFTTLLGSSNAPAMNLNSR